MPQFTLHRNYILRTTKGHIIGFKKDTPTNVPLICVHDAIAIGAVQLDGDKVDNLGPEEVKIIPLSPAERKDKVFGAFRIMKARGERSDFTGNGLPNNKRLPDLLGFELTNTERDKYWQEFREAEQEAIEQAKLDEAG